MAALLMTGSRSLDIDPMSVYTLPEARGISPPLLRRRMRRSCYFLSAELGASCYFLSAELGASCSSSDESDER